MNALGEFKNAAIGWFDLIAGRAEGAGRFNGSAAGLVNALGFYFAALLLTLLVQALGMGGADVAQVVLGIVVNLLPLAGAGLVILGTVAAIRPAAGFAALSVPATYALGFVLVAALILAIVAIPIFSNALLGVLAFMFYRLARLVGKMKVGISMAFAALSIVALVVLPLGLYMLTVPAVPAA